MYVWFDMIFDIQVAGNIRTLIFWSEMFTKSERVNEQPIRININGK